MKFKKNERADQKLTAFFTRNTPSSSQPRSSPPQRQTQSGTRSNAMASSSTAKPFVAQQKNKGPRADQEVTSVSSSSHKSYISISSDSVVVLSSPPKPKSRPIPKSDVPLDPRRTTRVTHHLAVPSTPMSVVPLKRSRSPSIQFVGTRQAIKPPSAVVTRQKAHTMKRKKKFETDSDNSLDSSVILVSPRRKAPIALKALSVVNISTSSPCKSPDKPSPPKKARVQEGEDVEMVPSSQSDEQELTAPRLIQKSTEDIKESVHRWRQEATSNSAPSNHWGMDMDADIDVPMDDSEIPYSSDAGAASSPSPPRSCSSEAEVMAGLTTSGNTSTTPTTPASPVVPPPALNKPLTPLPAGAPLPTTPVALSAASKTAQIIAQIKANALAANVSSPDEAKEMPEFRELDDTSSDEEDFRAFDLLQFTRFDKSKGKSVASCTAKDDDDPFSAAGRSSSRYALRDRTLSAGPSSPEPASASTSTRQPRIGNQPRASVSRLPQILTEPPRKDKQSKAKSRKKSFNPLDVLLNEKRLADKRGDGMEALKLAEQSMDVPMNDGEIDDGEALFNSELTREGAELMDEDAARRAVEEGMRDGSSPSGHTDEDAVAMLAEDDANMIGLKNGPRMKQILEGDRAKREMVKKVKVQGVSLWDHTPGPSHAEGKIQFPSVEVPPLRLLVNACEKNDDSTVAMLVGSGMLASVAPHNFIPLIPALCQLACSSRDLPSSEPAFRLLSYLWTKPFPEVNNLFLLFCSVVTRLGASPNVLTKMGWPVTGALTEYTYASYRAVAVYRLVLLAQMSSRAGALVNQDVPDMVLALMLIAIDPFSSVDLKLDIIVAINSISDSIKGDSNAVSATEFEICKKALRFVSGLTPISQAQFVSILSGGSGRATHIAMWLAHGLLVGEEILVTMQDGRLPPLANLTRLLSPIPGSGDMFDIQTNADMVDYEDLGYQVGILSVALSTIDRYVAEERRTGVPPAAESNILNSPKKLSTEKPPTELEKVRYAMDMIHGKIVDTRATHLDRSRTKAALQRLSMRIYYQRMAALKAGQRGGTKKKIVDFFVPAN